MTNNVNNSFAGLPTALVREILDKSGKIADDTYAPLNEINGSRESLRNQLKENSLIQVQDASGTDDVLTSCGIDGAHSFEKFIASHFACCAAFAAEGLTPQSGKTHWDNPAHKAVFHTTRKTPENEKILYAVMMEMQAELAAGAPHDIVFLNGSYITPFAIFMDILKYALGTKDSIISKEFLGRVKPSVMAFKQIFTSGSAAKIWTGIPKSSAKRELSVKLNLPPKYDESTLFTLLLSPGEYTSPVPVDQSELQRIKAIPINDAAFSSIRDNIAAAIANIQVIHFRPQSWTRALRIEIDSSVSENSQRLKQLLDTIKFQCGSPGVSEPYPVYSAEKLASNMIKAIPAIRKMAASQIASRHKDDTGDIFSLIMNMDKNSG
ncbi:hypothetical protein ACFL6K_05355 [Candidatus Latescibacterota bacterium]